MTLTLELPDAVAAQLTALLPEEEERNYFGVNAIVDALTFRQNETEDLISVVNQALDGVYANKGMIDFDEFCCQRDAEKAARKKTNATSESASL